MHVIHVDGMIVDLSHMADFKTPVLFWQVFLEPLLNQPDLMQFFDPKIYPLLLTKCVLKEKGHTLRLF